MDRTPLSKASPQKTGAQSDTDIPMGLRGNRPRCRQSDEPVRRSSIHYTDVVQ
jgi:hypothetical protein